MHVCGKIEKFHVLNAVSFVIAHQMIFHMDLKSKSGLRIGKWDSGSGMHVDKMIISQTNVVVVLFFVHLSLLLIHSNYSPIVGLESVVIEDRCVRIGRFGKSFKWAGSRRIEYRGAAMNVFRFSIESSDAFIHINENNVNETDEDRRHRATHTPNEHICLPIVMKRCTNSSQQLHTYPCKQLEKWLAANSISTNGNNNN